jgi:asparagine synthase (glutamine-hydrolysing)
MCGICGIFDTGGQGERSAPLVRQMASTLAHRGPDDEGFYVSPFCTLGHRRLKIIDLSSLGHQPMANEDRTVWVSFNGEIYNYLDLRAELVRRGHEFRSKTDTEVLVHLYEEKGADFLNDLNGMFALALWDSRRQLLMLARDRFGKKPLYYLMDGGCLAFASELKALLADARVPRDLNLEALSTYLALGYIPEPETIFRGIFKLPPASRLIVKREAKGGLQIDGPLRYWSLAYQPDHSLTESKCTTRIEQILIDAVRIRMRSDVPLGAFLSGGLDSSTVVALMAQSSEQPIETFSIGFDQESFDESEHAEVVARKHGTNHHAFRCTPDALEVLPALSHYYDEPFADSSAIPTYYLSKIARQHVTVAISGDGGDETFAGYSRYDNGMFRWNMAQFLPSNLIRKAFRLLADACPCQVRGWGILHRNSLPPMDSYIADLSLYLPREKRALMVSPPVTTSPDYDAIFSLANGLDEPRAEPEFLSQMQYFDQMLYLPGDILVKVDRATMAFGLELRAPLLDYRLAEFMATVPARLRYRRGIKKYLLKKVASRLLPPRAIRRPKMGFAVPLKQWLREEAATFARDILFSSCARQRGLFRSDEVERLFGCLVQGHRDVSHKLWALLFFELWCRHWLDHKPFSAANSPQSAIHVGS